jgi:rhodanese-related sulfurtransferase
VGIELNKKIYVHCKSGGRAKQAAELLTNMRYAKVIAIAATYEQIAGAMPTAAGAKENFFDLNG